MIIGRSKEIEKLNELYHGNSAELVALYGRRRVGKTFLIDEVFEDKIVFRHAGLSPIDEIKTESKRKSRMKDQLEHFYRSLKMAGYKGNKAPESWRDAFYMLEDLLIEKDDKKTRLLVFIDEIQWLDTPRANFMTGFEAFWNGWACHNKRVMVIVCGSSSSWVLNNVINNTGGLYNRVTHEMKLLPFSLTECEAFLESNGVVMSRYDIVQAYMMLGGIPYYLKYIDKKLSLAQNVETIFFSDNAILKDEFERLFSSLFVNPEIMMLIVKTLATKNAGFTRKELTENTGITDSGEFSKQLNALISGSFIVKYVSYGSGKREELYKLIDPFCLFYLHFIYNNKKGAKINWVNLADSQQVVAWRGYAFENVCWNHIGQIKKALGISGVVTSESLWSKRGTEEERGTQIDLIIDRNDNVVNMCEIKFYSDEFAVNKEYHFVIERRRKMLLDIVPKKATVHNTLITTYGLKHNEYYNDFVNVVTMDDLFSR